MQNNNSKAGKFAGKGYYIALILCAVAIGVTGYLYYRNVTGEGPSVETPNPTVDVLNPNASLGPQGSGATKPTLPPTQPPATTLETGVPIAGKLVMDYAMQTLCYNPTTRDWRVHNGMDYAAQAGTNVVAAADGTVYTVYEDEAMGYTVVIRHEGGYVTTYQSLSADVKVAAGEQVTMGQVIGTVGNTALMETALGDHLHFSVALNGNAIDPEDFFNLR